MDRNNTLMTLFLVTAHCFHYDSLIPVYARDENHAYLLAHASLRRFPFSSVSCEARPHGFRVGHVSLPGFVER